MSLADRDIQSFYWGVAKKNATPLLFVFLEKKCTFVVANLKLLLGMKRFILMIVAMAAVGTLSAQDPRSVLTSAEIAHDKAVTEQKQAVENARNEERRIIDAANERLSSVKDEYADAKEEYKRVLEEQKRRVEMAREKRDEVKIRYKQEKIRRKQEIAAAKARTKGVAEEHKSRVAQSKAEIARLKSESPKR